MKILKVDQKIFKQIKPNNTVVSYFTSPSKMGRLAEFDDNTKVLIETKGSDWEFLNIVKEQVTENGGKLNVIDSFTDKENRKITQYQVIFN